jgi:hypothetical protein
MAANAFFKPNHSRARCQHPRTLTFENLQRRELLTTTLTEVGVNFTVENDQDQPAVAIAPSGDAVVVWASDGQDGDQHGVYGQRFQADGQPIGPEFLVNTTTQGQQRRPTVAMHSDGTFVVAWPGNGPGGIPRAFLGSATRPLACR